MIEINPFMQLHRWDEVAESVFAVDENIAKIVAACAPEPEHLLLKIAFPYGFDIIKNGVFNIPTNNGQGVSFADNQILPIDLLDYDWRSIPLGIVIAGGLESYWQGSQSIISRALLSPGATFAKRTVFGDKSYNFQQAWSLTSGYRHVFLLPSVKDRERTSRIAKAFRTDILPPKIFAHQQSVFKKIAASSTTETMPWLSEVLIFTKPWFDGMFDIQYTALANYLRQENYKVIAKNDGHMALFDFIWHEFVENLQVQGFKAKSYVYEYVKNLILVALGIKFGLAPVCNEDFFPKALIQHAYLDEYKIRYKPLLMATKKLNWAKPKDAVFLSLQVNTQLCNLPKRKSTNSGLDDIRDIRRLIQLFYTSIEQGKNIMAKGSILEQIPHRIDFNFYHSEKDIYGELLSSAELADDPCLKVDDAVAPWQELDFPHASLFFKGCVKIASKHI